MTLSQKKFLSFLAVIIGIFTIFAGSADAGANTPLSSASTRGDLHAAADSDLSLSSRFYRSAVAKTFDNEHLAFHDVADREGSYPFSISPAVLLPEPRAFWLLGLGLVVIVVRKKLLPKKSVANSEQSNGESLDKHQA